VIEDETFFCYDQTNGHLPVSLHMLSITHLSDESTPEMIRELICFPVGDEGDCGSGGEPLRSCREAA